MPHPAFRFEAFELIPSARELRREGERVPLPPRAFRCLVLLVEQRDRVLGRDELIAALWPRGSATDVQLGQLILQCRRAIDDDGQAQRAIRTVAGFGYRWVLPTTVFDTDAAGIGDEAALPAASVDDAGTGEPAVAGMPQRQHLAQPTDAPAPAVGFAHTSTSTSTDDAGANGSADDPPDPNPSLATARGAARPQPPQDRRAPIALIAVALLLALVAILVVRSQQTAPAPTAPASTQSGTDRFVVLPLPALDGDEAWIRLGGMDLIGNRLRRSGLAVLPSDTTVSLLHDLPAETIASPARLATAVRNAADAARVVEATLVRDGDGWRADIAATAADGSRAVGGTVDTSPAVALRNAADRLVAALGHVPLPADDTAGVAETLQRARAAMLANEPDAARAILLADPALVRDQPRLRLQLAEVDIRAGRAQAARLALDTLMQDTADAPAPFRAELLAARATLDVRSGDFVSVGQRASDALAMLGASDDDPILRGRLHLMRGVSRISLQDYAGALVDNGIARDAFARAGDIGSVARVDGNLGVLEIMRGHPAQAEPYLERAIAQFGELGIVQEPIGNLQMLFVARRQQLRYPAAMQAIDQAWAQRARIRSPDSQLSVRLYRVQGLLRTGRLAEAATLLDDPANERTPADPADAERLALLRADLAWQRGRVDAALALLGNVAETELASADSDTPRADIAVLRSRLEHALHTPPPPDAALAMPSDDDTRSHPRQPWRWLAAANRAATAGDTALAEQRYQRALLLADSQGVPETLVAIIGDYVAFLVEQRRIDEAAAIANRAALWHDTDFDAALARLRVAHAQGQLERWRAALAGARGLAGERLLPDRLQQPPSS